MFLSYGCLVWLSDIEKWAQGISDALRPGGRLALVEYHPMPGAMDIDWMVKFDGMGGRPQTAPGVADYISDDPDNKFQNPEPTKRFAWGITEVFTALQKAGFEVNRMKEYPYSRGFARFPDLVPTEGWRFDPPEDRPRIPLMYSVVATKQSEG